MSILAQAVGDAEAAARLESWLPVYGLVGAMLAVVVGLSIIGKRTGERQVLLWPAAGIERISDIPGWAGAMIAFGCWALLTAGVGFYLDVAWPVGRGRDKELFTAPHTAIVLGLAGIALAAAMASSPPRCSGSTPASGSPTSASPGPPSPSGCSAAAPCSASRSASCGTGPTAST